MAPLDSDRLRAKSYGDKEALRAVCRPDCLAELHSCSCAGGTTGLLCYPMTTQRKRYPFEVLIAGTPLSAVLADQVKSMDWRQRRAVRIGAVSAAELAEVRAKIPVLI
jgi:hypothetical protein